MSVDRLPVTVIYGRLCAVTLAVVRVFVRPQKQFINKLDPGPTVSGLLSRNQRVCAHRNRLCGRHLKKFINGVSAGPPYCVKVAGTQEESAVVCLCSCNH